MSQGRPHSRGSSPLDLVREFERVISSTLVGEECLTLIAQRVAQALADVRPLRRSRDDTLTGTASGRA